MINEFDESINEGNQGSGTQHGSNDDGTNDEVGGNSNSNNSDGGDVIVASASSAESDPNQPLVNVEDEMKSSYLDYAMSVIVSRALPDVRDGLKPVHRRILFAMGESSCDYNKPYRKSARIVGDVMGKYHPHGDAAIYDSLVRMAQDFSLRVPLVDGQGNFGSVDGDSPASMRYTESRLKKISHTMLDDLDKDTVDFRGNYDNSHQEPVVLPARFPNVLVNGAGGIAVGMATNIPPHNLGEVIDGCCMFIKNHDVTIDELATVIQGPDFPTAGLILGHAGVNSAIRTGRGSVIMRGKVEIEKMSDKKNALIISELPYMVNKASLVEKTAELVRDKKIEGVSDLRDESDRNGMRVVIELKRDAIPELVMNQLYSYTQLQTSFGVNMLALQNGMPRTMNVLDVIRAFIDFREEVVLRRSKFLLNKAQDRAHVLIALMIAVNDIDIVIAEIRRSADADEAKANLMALELQCGSDVLALIEMVGTSETILEGNKFKFSETQAKAILEIKLQRLTALEKNKIADNLKELAAESRELMHILNSRERLLAVIEEELLAIKKEFATPRLTQIVDNEFEQDIEDLIKKEDMVVTVTHKGYIKRVPLSTYRAQKRGGRGKSALTMQEDDFTIKLFVLNTHTPVLFFSSYGKVYKLKVYRLPVGTAQSKGRALVNVFPLAPDEKITTVMPLPEDEEQWDNLNIMFATASGQVRRNDLSDFRSVQSNGKIAIRVDEGDSLVTVSLCTENDHVMLLAKSGKCVRFPVTDVRVFKSRTSDGVRGIKLLNKDIVVSMSILRGVEISILERDNYLKLPQTLRSQLKVCQDETEAAKLVKDKCPGLTPAQIMQYAQAEQFLLTVTENGYGKRSSAYEYKTTNRGTQGIINIITSARNGSVVSSFPVEEHHHIMLITNHGRLIRCGVDDIRITGRNTQGVTLCKSGEKGELIVSVAQISEGGGDDEEGDEGGAEGERDNGRGVADGSVSDGVAGVTTS